MRKPYTRERERELQATEASELYLAGRKVGTYTNKDGWLFWDYSYTGKTLESLINLSEVTRFVLMSEAKP